MKFLFSLAVAALRLDTDTNNGPIWAASGLKLKGCLFSDKKEQKTEFVWHISNQIKSSVWHISNPETGVHIVLVGSIHGGKHVPEYEAAQMTAAKKALLWISHLLENFKNLQVKEFMTELDHKVLGKVRSYLLQLGHSGAVEKFPSDEIPGELLNPGTEELLAIGLHEANYRGIRTMPITRVTGLETKDDRKGVSGKGILAEIDSCKKNELKKKMANILSGGRPNPNGEKNSMVYSVNEEELKKYWEQKKREEAAEKKRAEEEAAELAEEDIWSMRQRLETKTACTSHDDDFHFHRLTTFREKDWISKLQGKLQSERNSIIVVAVGMNHVGGLIRLFAETAYKIQAITKK